MICTPHCSTWLFHSTDGCNELLNASAWGRSKQTWIDSWPWPDWISARYPWPSLGTPVPTSFPIHFAPSQGFPCCQGWGSHLAGGIKTALIWMNYHKETEIIHVSETIEDEWLFKDWIRGVWGNYTQMTLVQVGCICVTQNPLSPTNIQLQSRWCPSMM